jgi:hypothetical protein
VSRSGFYKWRLVLGGLCDYSDPSGPPNPSSCCCASTCRPKRRSTERGDPASEDRCTKHGRATLPVPAGNDSQSRLISWRGPATSIRWWIAASLWPPHPGSRRFVLARCWCEGPRRRGSDSALRDARSVWPPRCRLLSRSAIRDRCCRRRPFGSSRYWCACFFVRCEVQQLDGKVQVEVMVPSR